MVGAVGSTVVRWIAGVVVLGGNEVNNDAGVEGNADDGIECFVTVRGLEEEEGTVREVDGMVVDGWRMDADLRSGLADGILGSVTALRAPDSIRYEG